MVIFYEVNRVRPLVINFYKRAWKNVDETRRIFEEIGLELTKYALDNVPFFSNIENGYRVYAGPIARAGCGLFRPSVVKLLKNWSKKERLPFETFGMGLRRPHGDPSKNTAKIYWNTLRYIKSDLSSSHILLYDMGSATGSTIEGATKELVTLGVNPNNIIFLLGAAGIEQTQKRLESFTPEIKMVIGSRWRYDEEAGPSQFYLTQIFDGKWIKLPPRDWGRCVSDMKDEATVKSFINWIEDTMKVSDMDKKRLFKIWSENINEKIVEGIT